ncbi:MAG TPA: VWA domain-containing protein, partial [Pyrinomonadaceae bacterium]|nr:VWA domain-containing protein [Pyrinomonadaceae bacterium]
MNRRLGFLFLLAAFGPNLLGQQGVTPPPPVPQSTPQKIEDADVVKITTNLVQVDAVVTDKNGKIVTDLKPEEVEILEDGRKQKITHFSFNATETAAPTISAKSAAVDRNAPPIPPSKLKPEDVRRTIAVVVDDLGLSWESTSYVRRALKKFVDEQIQPGDLVAIIRTSGGMGALQQFTADKRQLYAAVERVKWNSLGRGGVSAFAPMEPPLPGADLQAANEDLNRFREDVFAVGTLGAISYVVKGLRELPGRKSILLVSDGFRVYERNDLSKQYLAQDRLRRLIDQANRASVVIYTMNATGLQYFGLTAADSTYGRSSDQVGEELGKRRDAAMENQDGLEYLARETGGIAIKNNNDLSGGIKRVLDDQHGFYLIGYRPDNATFDPRTGRRTFHKLSLKITRPGKFNVRMRNGFFGVTEAERTEPRTLGQEMVAALTSPFGATGVHLQLTSFFANDASAGSYMRSVLHVDTHDLTFTDEPNNLHKCVFDVVAITFGDNGTVVDQPVGKTYTLALRDEVYQRAIRDGLVYYLTVPIKKAGAYQLRISLRDSATKRIGSASQFIDVPDLKKNRLALSGLILAGT